MPNDKAYTPTQSAEDQIREAMGDPDIGGNELARRLAVTYEDVMCAGGDWLRVLIARAKDAAPILRQERFKESAASSYAKHTLDPIAAAESDLLGEALRLLTKAHGAVISAASIKYGAAGYKLNALGKEIEGLLAQRKVQP